MGLLVTLYMYYIPAKCLRKITSKSVLHENLLHVKSYVLGTKGKLRQGGWGKEYHWALTVYTIHYTRNILYIPCIHNQPQYEKTELGDKRPYGNWVIRALTLLMCTVFGIQNCRLSLNLTHLHTSHLRQFSPYQKIAWQTRVIGRNHSEQPQTFCQHLLCVRRLLKIT